jgi:D-alanyl-D-alanine carboxypeptidase
MLEVHAEPLGRSATGGSFVDLTDDLVLFGNGGIIASADDLLAMMRAVVSGRLLPASLAARARPTLEQSYGLGLARYVLNCGIFFGHGGGVNGTASIALASPDGDRSVVVAVNLRLDTDPDVQAIAQQMLCP